MRGKWMYVLAGIAVVLLVFYMYRKYRVPPVIDFPNISVADLQGRKVSLNDYAGKPMVISFAASWCGPCMKELREMRKVSAEVLEAANVVVISDEPLERIVSMRQQADVPFDFLKLQGRFSDIGINSIPTTYLLNSSGKVVKEEVGYIDWSDPSARQHLLKLMSN